MTALFADDHPLILSAQRRADRFHAATLDEGGLLDLRACNAATAAEFLPAASRILPVVNSWRAHPASRELLDTLHAGFVVNETANAFALREPGCQILAINSGLVWLFHELFFTLFSHPLFLPELAGEAQASPPFEDLASGIPYTKGIVGRDNTTIWFRPHPSPFNDVRGSFALVLSQMAIEFTFYHELGHLTCAHSEILHEAKLSAGIHELATRRPDSTVSQVELLQALEYDADGFAIQVALGNRLMLNYFDLNRDAAEDLPTPVELSYYCWALAVAAVFRLFSQTIAGIGAYNSRSHPHPLMRSLAATVTVQSSTALRDDPNRDRIVELCVRAPFDLAAAWRTFLIPGHQHDPVINDSLVSEAAPVWHSAAQALASLKTFSARRPILPLVRALTNGAGVDPDWHPSRIAALRGLTRA